jgi:hypothetical protein
LRNWPGAGDSVLHVVNGSAAFHAFELELTVRPPAEVRDRAHLDRARSRAQRRRSEAIRELARVRKLAVPTISVNLADKRLNVVTVGTRALHGTRRRLRQLASADLVRSTRRCSGWVFATAGAQRTGMLLPR